MRGARPQARPMAPAGCWGWGPWTPLPWLLLLPLGPTAGGLPGPELGWCLARGCGAMRAGGHRTAESQELSAQLLPQQRPRLCSGGGQGPAPAPGHHPVTHGPAQALVPAPWQRRGFTPQLFPEGF